jgi:hypothetical protein
MASFIAQTNPKNVPRKNAINIELKHFGCDKIILLSNILKRINLHFWKFFTFIFYTVRLSVHPKEKEIGK